MHAYPVVSQSTQRQSDVAPRLFAFQQGLVQLSTIVLVRRMTDRTRFGLPALMTEPRSKAGDARLP